MNKDECIRKGLAATSFADSHTWPVSLSESAPTLDQSQPRMPRKVNHSTNHIIFYVHPRDNRALVFLLTIISLYLTYLCISLALILCTYEQWVLVLEDILSSCVRTVRYRSVLYDSLLLCFAAMDSFKWTVCPAL